MEFCLLAKVLNFSIIGVFLFFFSKILIAFWISPLMAYMKLRKNGFGGPTPNFPMGNLKEMKKITVAASSSSNSSLNNISNDIHYSVFPYFSQWQKSHGKVFIYWLGTEPFLYIADPEFLKRMSSGVMGKTWGKPNVFKHDRKPMFGNGLVMVEGDDWVRHRHIITPALSPVNLKAMASLMVESTTTMLNKWQKLITSGQKVIDVESEIIATAGEIIGKTSFGIGYENGRQVFEKLRAMQMTLFKTNRYVGVPFSKLLCPKKTLEAEHLGKEIDTLLIKIIEDRKNGDHQTRAAASDFATGVTVPIGAPQNDLLGLLVESGRLGTRELVDECKTFFFGGHETTALALSWTLLLLAVNPEWQNELREEIREVVQDREIDYSMLAGLKKMGWVMNEVLRLYSPAPNVQRQSREDIKVNNLTIPKGTNMWIDVVGMHHDPELWGEDVYEFKPERFKNDFLYGGCNHKMGFLPFGFGGRMCIGRHLSNMEYKVVLTLILSKFSFSVSPTYTHSPAIMLSLRPSLGLPLIVTPLVT